MADVGNEAGGRRPAGEEAIPEQAAELATEVSEAREQGERRALAVAFSAAAQKSARFTGHRLRQVRRGASAGTGWLSGQVMTMAPRLRVRDAEALRAQFPGASAEEVADALIEGAAKASATVGAAVGAWATLPVLPAFPVEIATETLALVGIEIKLVAELHEAYGMPASGNVVDRMTAYVAAWAHRRGVAAGPAGLIMVAGSPLARRLRRRLAARAGRTVFSLGPMLTGAAAGAVLNRRETRRLGQDVRADLRRRALAGDQPPAP
jgi:hypothetical protein